MSTQQDHYKELVKLLLPKEIFDYFEIPIWLLKAVQFLFFLTSGI